MAAHTNIQVAVDAKNNMIVEQAVTNQVVDMGLLTQSAEPARAILDAPVRSSSASSAPYRPRFSRSASIFSARFSSARLAEGGQGRRARGPSSATQLPPQSRGHRGLRDPKRVRDAYARRGT
jgi:hypothetical protein